MYIYLMYVDKDGYIESEHISSESFCSLYQIDFAINYYTELTSLRDFKVCSRNPRLYILRSELIDRRYYVELTLFKLEEAFAELLEIYISFNGDRHYIDSLIYRVSENLLSWEQVLDMYENKFSIKDFIACDDGDYGLEFYRVMDVDTENEEYIVEDFRGEISKIRFNNPHYQFWEKAIADKESFYKNKILDYKNLIRSWAGFY